MYEPENWTVIELPTGLRKVFATWRGSYATSDSWQLNSGIVGTDETDAYYDFHGASGSVYRCHKHLEGIRGLWLNSVLADIIERTDAKIVPYNSSEQVESAEDR